MLIGIGGTIYLTLYNNNKIIGAFLFCIGLISICYFKLPLFTGKVGYLVTKEVTYYDLIYMLCGNILGAMLLGVLTGFARPELHQIASEIVMSKYKVNLLIILLNSILCGMLMFVSVDIFKKQGYNNVIGILFAIPTFILSGFEHSIAYSFYAGVAHHVNILTLLIMILGNAIGGCIIPFTLKFKN